MNFYTNKFDAGLLSSKLVFSQMVNLQVQFAVNNIDRQKEACGFKQQYTWGHLPNIKQPVAKFAGKAVRTEAENKSYYDTLNKFAAEPKSISEELIKEIHQSLFKHCPKGSKFGSYKRENIVVTITDSGNGKVYFVPVTQASYVSKHMGLLVKWYNTAIEDKQIHPLLLIHLFIYEFVSIHPFPDGNGRLSRVLTTLLLLRNGYEFAGFASYEKAIERDRGRYLTSYFQSQRFRGTEDEKIYSSLFFFLESLSLMTNNVNL
ncbi:Fic family protein [Parasediminibacterium sp. JCM 36343]|uniref:Fic family protein n=1 Tax=Parasediminibacterium sp. JCM 36343 TaxID=3374279 RepID=UPI003979B973